tara:strand:- start:6 stop:686 length:681 start_codon:yes stop_codon:yes gene_type:complete
MSFTSKFRADESQYKLGKQIVTFICTENNLDFNTVWESVSNKDIEYFDRYHRREKKKNEPLAGIKKPRTAFSFFTQENRSIIASKHPNLEFGAISKLVGQQWKSLNDSSKNKYLNLQKEDRIRYQTARQAIMDDYAQRTRQEQELKDIESQRQADIIATAEKACIKAASEMSSTKTSKSSKSKSSKNKSKATQEASASTPSSKTSSKSSSSKSAAKKGKKGKKGSK